MRYSKSRGTVKKRLLASAGLLLLLLTSFGEEERKDSGKIEEELNLYSVVSTRTRQPLDQASPSISVVTSDNFERGQYQTLDEILNQITGMSLATTGQIGGVTSLFTRGSNSDHTVILLDGRKLNGGFSGNYNLAQLNLDNLERIEVMRGASSTLYGAEGIGGVISLFSRSQSMEKVKPRLEVEAGSYGTYRKKMSAGFANDRAEMTLGVSHLKTDNQEPNCHYRITNLMTHGSAKISKSLDLDFTSIFFDALSGNPDNRKAPTYPAMEDFQATRTWLLSPGIDYQPNEKLNIRLFYSQSEDSLESKTSSFLLHTNSETEKNEVDLQVDWTLGKLFSTTGGAVYRNEDFLQMDLDSKVTTFDKNWNSLSVYFQSQWQPAEGFYLTGGGRFDDYSDFGSPMTGNLMFGKSFSSLGFSLFGKLATAYSVPQAVDLYGLFGNPSLNAEESESWELGFRQELGSNIIRFEGTYFANDISNLIAGFPLLNIGNAQTKGFEFSVTLAPNERLQLYANYTFLEAKDRNNNLRLLRRPRHSGSLGIHLLPSSKIKAGFYLRFNSDRVDIDGGTFARITAQDYVVARLYGSYRIHEKVEIFGRIENLFNHQYDEVDGFKALDRAIYLGARIILGQN